MSKEAPINSDLLEARVVAHLRTLILEGQLPDRTRLRDEALARDLGVSRGPIREAFKALAHEGLVEIIPRRGAYVSWVPSEDLFEVVMIRAAIEQVALQLAMSSQDRDFHRVLQDEVDKMRRAVPSIDWEGTLRAESGFHDAIYFFSRSKRLNQMWMHLRPTVIASFRNDRGYYASIDSVPGAHQLLLDKIVSGDQSVALAELRAHICPSSNRIVPNGSGPPTS